MNYSHGHYWGAIFIRNAGIALNLGNGYWSFEDEKYDFWPEPVRSPDIPVTSMEVRLRQDEGATLSAGQRRRFNDLLSERVSTFGEGGGPTPFAQHLIETGGTAPVSTALYRMSLQKREELRLELDNMSNNEIIEECESE